MSKCKRMITSKQQLCVKNQNHVKAKLICLHCAVSIYLCALLSSYRFLNKQRLNEFTTIAQTVLRFFVLAFCYEWWVRLMSTNQTKRTLQNSHSPPEWYLRAIVANVDVLHSVPFSQEQERSSVCGSLIDVRGESCRSRSNGNAWIGEDGRGRLK